MFGRNLDADSIGFVTAQWYFMQKDHRDLMDAWNKEIYEYRKDKHMVRLSGANEKYITVEQTFEIENLNKDNLKQSIIKLAKEKRLLDVLCQSILFDNVPQGKDFCIPANKIDELVNETQWEVYCNPERLKGIIVAPKGLENFGQPLEEEDLKEFVMDCDTYYLLKNDLFAHDWR